MSSPKEVLEYQVTPDGRVSTNGFYRIVTEEQWSSLPELRQVRQTRYKPALAAMREGAVIAMPATNRKKAWERKRGLAKAAAGEGLKVQTKTVADPDRPGQPLVLARLGPPAEPR